VPESIASRNAASSTPSSASSLSRTIASWIDRFWQDQLPTPGRLNNSLRIVLSSVITLILLQALRMPQAALGLYFVFIVGRDSPAVSLRSSIFSLLALMSAAALVFAVVGLTENDPVVRLLSVTVVAFLAGMFMLSTTVAVLASTWGFIYCLLIAFWENQAPPDYLVKQSLYLIGTVAIAIACSVAVEYIFGTKDPVKELQNQRRIRYQALETMFSLMAQGALREQVLPAVIVVHRLAAAGQRPMQHLYNAIIDRNLDPGSLPFGTRVRITMQAQLMDVSAAFATQNPVVTDPPVQQRCAHIAELCGALKNDLVTVSEAAKEHSSAEQVSLLDRVDATLHGILSMPMRGPAQPNRELIALPSSKVSIVIPGAFKSPETIAFALKLSLCATLCYIFYHAVAWPGISTSVTTVFITGLSTSGAIKQKMIFRLVGSTIGGLVLGIGATVYLFPHMDTISSLVLLVTSIALLSAWISAGRHFNYVGLQIAFSFYLVAFEGFSAPTELAPARDRLIGIFVALILMSLVFDLIWPVRTVTEMRRALAGILRNEARYLRIAAATSDHDTLRREADQLRDQIGKTAAGIRTMSESIDYEFGVDRNLHRRSGQEIIQSSLTAVAFFWNQFVILHTEEDWDFITHPELAAMRRTLADGMDAMAISVTQKAPFPEIDPAASLDPALFTDPRYGEYTRNSVARFNELQTILADLRPEV
jgi:multidrug resistance protein MdtO